MSGGRRGLHIGVRGGKQNNGAIALVGKFVKARGSLGRLNGLLGDGYKMNNSMGSKRVLVRKRFGRQIVRLLGTRKCARAGWPRGEGKLLSRDPPFCGYKGLVRRMG